jgi:RNA polymerase sigma factor (sigma-70 family)
MATASLRRLVNYVKLATPADDGASDAHLIRRLAGDRDQAAFEALVRRHGPAVLRACRRVVGDGPDAEDAFQTTFLVLWRDAGRVRRGQSVGSWLYGVAHRIACQARSDAARRRRREHRVAAATAGHADPPDLSWREACAILHEEMNHLPDRYRLPLLLCYLEGKSRDEAAQALGWSPGTVKGRLERGRERLRRRLTRRGVELSAGLLATLAAPAAVSTVPVAWTDAVLCLVESPVAAAQTGTATALAGAVLRSMRVHRIKSLTALVLVGALSIGIGASGPWPAAETPSAPPPDDRPAPPAAPADGDALVYSGRVLDPDGQPLGGAKLYLTYHSSGRFLHQERATSGPDGRFGFTVKRGEFDTSGEDEPWKGAYVTAVAPGYGVVAASARMPSLARTLTLRLAPDVTVKGRVVDLEGRPIPGVRIGLGVIHFAQGEDGRHVAFDAPRGQYRLQDSIYDWLDVITDRDGRFEARSLGRDRLIEAFIRGPTIEHRAVRIVTRPAPARQVPGTGPADRQRGRPMQMQYGVEFTHVAAPCKPIVGVVRDKETARPIPGVYISSSSGRSDDARAWTESDGQGRYRLEGLPGAIEHTLNVSPPPGVPYTNTTVQAAANSPGVEPVTFDIELERRLVARGRLTDQTTGHAVQGFVEYLPLADNPHSEQMRPTASRRQPPRFLTRSDKDGRFVLPVLPGRGLVFVKAGDKYRPARIDSTARDTGLVDPNDPSLLNTKPRPTPPEGYHAYRLIEPVGNVREIPCDITLDPGRSVTIQAIAPDGPPHPGVWLTGQQAAGPSLLWPAELDQGTGVVYALAPGERRRIVLHAPGKELAGHRVLSGHEPSPAPIKLQPTGTVTGRLVDESGRPLEGAKFQVLYEDGEGRMGILFPHGFQLPTRPEQSGVNRPSRLPDRSRLNAGFTTEKSDGHGRFRLTELIPDLPFSLHALMTRPIENDPTGERRRIVGIVEVTRSSVSSGQTKDLGDLTVKPPPDAGP